MEIGMVCDIDSLFSGLQRDFLIRNNGEKVKVDSLKGKTVAIYFVSFVERSMFSMPQDELLVNLKQVYADLSPDNNFEVVLVADVTNEYEDRELFHQWFLRMPWLAIPQDDRYSRSKIFSIIGSKLTPVCPILDNKGMIVNLDATYDFDVYGSEGYPFTPERINEIRKDDMLARASMSSMSPCSWLTTFTDGDFLIRSKWRRNIEKVPISYLERIAVGFCFYPVSRPVDDLIDLYIKLHEMGKYFEVVLINSPNIEDKDEKQFMQFLSRTPFLGLPSNDRSYGSYLKLMRIFQISASDLVIVVPGAKFPDTYGLEVIDHYGIEAYPFTRKRVVEMEVERLNESLTLESILFSGNCKYIAGNGAQKITAHHLMNKTILLLFTKKSSSRCQQLMPRLVTWYNKTKKTVKEDLEIIHIPYDYDPAKKCYYGTMPWLQFPYDAKYIQKLFRGRLNLYRSMPLIIAFGADGKILNMNNIECPFSDVDFFSEVERKVAFNMGWPVP